jgi:hypothetical protein
MPGDLTTLILGVDLGGTKILTYLTESASHWEDLKNTMASGGRVMVKE